MKKLPGPKKRSMFSPASSECGTAKLKELDWDNWWQDGTFPSTYIHVRKKVWRGDETWHRVYPKTLAGYTCRRIAVYDGIFFWLHDATKPTTK